MQQLTTNSSMNLSKAKYKKRFRYPETFMRFGGEIVAIPIKPHSRPAGEKHKTEPER